MTWLTNDSCVIIIVFSTERSFPIYSDVRAIPSTSSFNGVDLPTPSIRLNLPESLSLSFSHREYPAAKSTVFSTLRRKMNLLAFGLILICSHAWAIVIDDNFVVEQELASLSSQLKDALNGVVRDTIRNGNSGLGIKPLDPFTENEMTIKINEKLFQTAVDGQLTNVRVEGLSQYRVNSASFKFFGLKLQADLTWPLIVARANYSMNGTVLNHVAYGTGGMDGTAQDFRFQIYMKFKLSGKHIKIQTVSTTITLRKFDFHATGLYNDDEKSKNASVTVSNRLPKLIQERQRDLTNYINRIIMQEGNKYLSTKTLKELKKQLG